MGRRRRSLSAEERALWSRVAETARPSADRRPAPPPEPPAAPQPASTDAFPRDPLGDLRDDTTLSRPPAVLRPTGRRAEPRTSWTPLIPDRPRPVAPNTPGLDRGTARRLGRGKLEPQARLDLHGMTADRAHDALSAFLANASAQGLRCVLAVSYTHLTLPTKA
jgi:DNA-nicking Smr family endonuclease